MAAWWDEKQGEEGDRWHRTLIDPVLERVLGDVEGVRVLEVASGNGYLARRFARRGARVTAGDGSEGMLERADGLESLELGYFCVGELPRMQPLSRLLLAAALEDLD